jgi:hypothetical protein
MRYDEDMRMSPLIQRRRVRLDPLGEELVNRRVAARLGGGPLARRPVGAFLK